MFLGTRKIRSAGRTSGSIEITLPTELHILEGTECRLMVRDGPRPEIVFQPELSAAQALFRELWGKLRLGLAQVDEIGDFCPSDFAIALFPSPHWQERPPLAYADALSVLHRRSGRRDGDPEAATRLLAFQAVVGGYRLGLEGALALAFGDALSYLITGTAAGLCTDFERGMAHRIFWGEGQAPQAVRSPFHDAVWVQARPGLRRVYDQFRTWQENPDTYAAARENWYRALTVEMGLQVSTMDEYMPVVAADSS